MDLLHAQRLALADAESYNRAGKIANRDLIVEVIEKMQASIWYGGRCVGVGESTLDNLFGHMTKDEALSAIGKAQRETLAAVTNASEAQKRLYREGNIRLAHYAVALKNPQPAPVA